MGKLVKTLGILGLVGLGFLPMKSVAQSEADSIRAKPEVTWASSGDLVGQKRFFGIGTSEGLFYTHSVKMEKGDFSSSLSGSFDLQGEKWYASDSDVSYTLPLVSALSFTVANDFFVYNAGGGRVDWGSLVYGGIDAKQWPLSPFLYAYHLIKFGGGQAVESGVSRPFSLPFGLTLHVEGGLGFNNKALREDVGFSYLGGKISIDIPAGNFLFSPKVDFFKSLSDSKVPDDKIILGLEGKFTP